MGNTVLKIENLSKHYRLGQVGTGTLSHDLNLWWAKICGKENPYSIVGDHVDDYSGELDSEYICALKDINLEVKQGEILGIIGRNGAGKSTLLKLVSRITSPTSGSIKIKGRIASLLEIGTGMHPELTGKENVYLNGTIMGMKQREITARFDEIIDFAGVEMFLDTPVKRYSSGMRTRLGFAIAAHLEPDILIVDEVLAVGDTGFQQKCLGKMSNISHEGRTILFVSHNLAAIEKLCYRAILLKGGKKIIDDTPDNVIKYYLEKNITNGSGVNVSENENILQISSIKISSIQNDKYIRTGDNIRVELFYKSNHERYLENISILLIIKDYFENTLFVCNSKIEGSDFKSIPPCGGIMCDISKPNLLPGKYKVDLQIKMKNMVICRIENITSFDIYAGDFYGTGRLPDADKGGSFAIRSTWTQK